MTQGPTRMVQYVRLRSATALYLAAVDLENVESSVQVPRLGDTVCGPFGTWGAENNSE